MRLSRALAALLVALSSTLPSMAIERVRSYTIKDGLADSSPRFITQDSEGILWICTWDGISRFDGGSFESVDNRMSTFFGTTRSVFEAGNGVYWICNHSGINRINLLTGECESFKLGYDKVQQSIEAFIMAVSEGGTVFCTLLDWGICHYNAERNEMVPFNIKDVNTGRIADILCVGEDRLMVREDSGVTSLVRYESGPEGIRVVSSEFVLGKEPISGIFKTDNGIGLVAGGLLHLWDETSETVTNTLRIPAGVFSAGASKGDLASISYRDSKTYEVSLKDGSLREIPALKGRNVACMLYGTEGILWAGVNGGGLLAIWDDSSGMNLILNKDVTGNDVANVSTFMEIPGDELLVGTEGNGFYLLRPDGTSKIFGKEEGLNNEKIYVFERALGSDVFIGHEGGGINVFAGGKVKSFLTDDANIHNIYTIRRDDEADCWYLGVFGQGIARLRAKKGPGGDYIKTGIDYWYFNDPEQYSGKSITDIIPTRDGKLIVGTLSEGCLVFDIDSESFMDLKLCEETVLCLFLEDDYSLWIGTGGFGLQHVTRDNSGNITSKTYDRESGLRDLSIHGILKDSAGKIWVSTNIGLSSLNPVTGEIVNYYGNDDLQSDEFSNSACLVASDGTLLFGGVDGFNRFDPLKVSKRDFEPDPHIIRFSLMREPERLFPTNEEIVLKHNENYFSISFSAIEYIENSNCEYSYRLEGFDDQWIHQSKASPVTYTNLPHGKYSFQVRCTNGDKKWGSKTASLPITVRRPWWNTPWAWLVYALLVGGSIYTINQVARMRAKRKQEMELEILNKQHENETYEAKLRFFTNIAHEFGTPLTLISGAGEQLRWTGNLASKPAKYVNIIKDNADRMMRLIKELMDFRKVDTGNYPLTYSKFDMTAMTRTVCEGYSGQGESSGVSMELDVPEDPIWIVSDYGAVEKILHNLVSNAYKYTPEQGSIKVALKPLQDSGIQLSVTNSGKGIKPEDLPKVFDRFVVLENLESEAREGRIERNGIGLALVSSLVNTLGGKVTVASERKKYTEFTVTLPSADDQMVEVEDPALNPELYDLMEADEDYQTAPRDMTIIVVDDEKAIRDLVADILSDRYKVLQASDGKEAVELISHGLPDLVITDIAMPGMNGIELCRYLKENEITRNIPIVFLSFMSDIQNEISSFETGGEAFIPKPFYPRHLNAVVGKILSGREALKTYYSSAISNSDLLNEKIVKKGDRDFIMKVTSLIETDLSNEEISPAFLAGEMNISKAQLYRKLKELVDMSPVEFVRSIRLEKAAHLLKTTSLTAQEIMYSVGFNNKSYFYREFGKKYGMSPKEYRMSE